MSYVLAEQLVTSEKDDSQTWSCIGKQRVFSDPKLQALTSLMNFEAFLFCISMALGIKPTVMQMLGKHSTAKPYPQPLVPRF